MKPLTIDELKVLQVGDWVWVTTADNKYGTYGRVCQKFDDENFRVETIESYIVDLYSDYGTKWLAYKNKEQAEAKGEIVELPCKVGDTVWVINAWSEYGDTTKGEPYVVNRYELIEGKARGFIVKENDCEILQNAPCHGVQPYVFTNKAEAERHIAELKGEKL